MQIEQLPSWVELDKVRTNEITGYHNLTAHLGVTVAVGDTLQGEVSILDGFWATRKVRTTYKNIADFVEKVEKLDK